MGLSRYYKQMAEMGLVLADCPNQLIDGSTMDIFRMFADKASRLSADVQYLKEYTLQIKDMYQARIDVHQNRVMQFLTIVTTIFMPLTLITGWYGMNFAKMPELSWEFGYAMVIFLAVIIIVIEILIFKKKRWL